MLWFDVELGMDHFDKDWNVHSQWQQVEIKRLVGFIILFTCSVVSRFKIQHFYIWGRNQIHHRDILIQMQLNNDWCMKKTTTTTSQFTNKPVNSTMKKTQIGKSLMCFSCGRKWCARVPFYDLQEETHLRNMYHLNSPLNENMVFQESMDIFLEAK